MMLARTLSYKGSNFLVRQAFFWSELIFLSDSLQMFFGNRKNNFASIFGRNFYQQHLRNFHTFDIRDLLNIFKCFWNFCFFHFWISQLNVWTSQMSTACIWQGYNWSIELRTRNALDFESFLIRWTRGNLRWKRWNIGLS